MNRTPRNNLGRQSDRRWVIVAEDGRYTTIGRATDPTEEELEKAEDSMRRQGVAGWLAVMSGSAYGAEFPSLMNVRPLASPVKSWADASAACLESIRKMREQS